MMRHLWCGFFSFFSLFLTRLFVCFVDGDEKKGSFFFQKIQKDGRNSHETRRGTKGAKSEKTGVAKLEQTEKRKGKDRKERKIGTVKKNTGGKWREGVGKTKRRAKTETTNMGQELGLLSLFLCSFFLSFFLKTSFLSYFVYSVSLSLSLCCARCLRAGAAFFGARFAGGGVAGDYRPGCAVSSRIVDDGLKYAHNARAT